MANDYENGVWRTVGGRRIFIRDGESLSEAMKKSGKFKNAKKDKKLMEDAKQLDEMSEKNKREKDEQFKKDIEEYNKIPQEERINAFVEGKNWKDLVAESSKGALKEMRESEVKSQQVDIEKASGMKVKEAFETNLYGNGKADRFVLEDGRIVEHTTESFGQKEDKWAVHPKGMEGKSERFENFKQVTDYLKGGSESKDEHIRKSFDKLYGIERMDKVSRGEFINGLKEQNRIAQSDYDSLQRTYGFQSKGGSNNNAYKKAFEDYKKKHPNSKITLNKFIDMSEGK